MTRRRPNRARQGPKARTGLQKQQTGFSQQVSPGVFRAPDMPKELSVSLYFRQQFDTQTEQLFRQTFGIIEYLRNVPEYAPELYALYRYSRVTAVTYDFEVVNLERRPLEILAGILPMDEAGSATIAQIGEKPGTVRRLVSPLGGMDRAKITKRAAGQQWFGNPYYTKDYWVDETQANSLTPLDPLEPVMLLAIQPVLAGTSVAFVVVTKIRYTIQFFDLKVSRQLGAKAEDPEEHMEDSPRIAPQVVLKANQPAPRKKP